MLMGLFWITMLLRTKWTVSNLGQPTVASVHFQQSVYKQYDQYQFGQSKFRPNFSAPLQQNPTGSVENFLSNYFFPLTFSDRKHDSSFFDDVIKKYVTSSTVGRSQELFVTCPIIGFQSEHYLILRLDSIVELKRQGEYFSHWQHELKVACHCMDKLTINFLILIKQGNEIGLTGVLQMQEQCFDLKRCQLTLNGQKILP